MEYITAYFQSGELNITLALTGLIISLFAILTASKYIKNRQKEFYVVVGIFVISFLLVIFTKNWLVFIVAWEMVTISTAVMLLWQNRGLAGQYFIIQFLGSSFLIYAILLAMKSGYTEIMPVNDIWLQNLLIIGLGMKSAIFGLHFWLPAVHSQAPAPVSALLSGWVVKLGFVVYLKFIPAGNLLLLLLGISMIFYGGIRALRSSDYKVLLAYSTISQLGFIAIGIASGTAIGRVGAVLHIIAHSLAKSTLFNCSGYLIEKYKSRSIFDFIASKKRPWILNAALAAGFSSLMGFPLFAGFNSKYLIKHSLDFLSINIFAEWGLTFLLYTASLITVLYSTRFLYIALFRQTEPDNGSEILKRGKAISKRESLVLSLSVLMLIILGFMSISLLRLFSAVEIHYDYIGGLVEFLVILLIGTFILKHLKLLKSIKQELPSMDRLFYNINKGLHLTARFLYSVIYLDFQYQLLWIPVFIIVLFIYLVF